MKRFKFLLFLMSTFLVMAKSNAQDDLPLSRKIDKISLGLGIGFDYGGFGANVLLYPSKNFGLFGGIGYALAGNGLNAGTKIRFISKKPDTNADFYAVAMYGYNAAIVVAGATEYNKFFYGPTLGAGLDFRTYRMRRGYFSMALLLPVRSSGVNTYIDHLKSDHGVVFKNELIPVGFSLGYRFIVM